MIELVSAKPGDTALLNLRPEDAAEAGPDWREKVEDEVARGQSVVAAWDRGELVALFGVTRGPDFIGPWMLASPLISRHRVTALRHARNVATALRETRETVGNYIGKHARRNRHFVRSLGFVIVESPSGSHDFFYLPKTNV